MLPRKFYNNVAVLRGALHQLSHRVSYQGGSHTLLRHIEGGALGATSTYRHQLPCISDTANGVRLRNLALPPTHCFPSLIRAYTSPAIVEESDDSDDLQDPTDDVSLQFAHLYDGTVAAKREQRRRERNAQELLEKWERDAWILGNSGPAKTDACSDVLQKFAEMGDIARAERAWDILRESGGVPDIYCYSKLMTIYRNAKRYDDALALAELARTDGMEPNLVFRSIIVSVYCEQGEMTKAADYVKRMKFRGCAPDLKLYATMMAGYAKAGDTVAAEKLLRELRENNVKITREVMNPYLNAFCVAEEPEQARKRLGHLIYLGVKPDSISFNTVTKGFAAKGDFEGCLSVLSFMYQTGVAPDIATLNTILGAVPEKDLSSTFQRLLETMAQTDAKPDAITYSIMINRICQTGGAEEAERFLLSQVPPPLYCNYHFAPVITAFGKQRDKEGARRVFGSAIAAGVVPSNFVYSALLRGLVGGRTDVRNAEELFADMVERKVPLSQDIYNLMITIYCRHGMFDEAFACFNEMSQHSEVTEKSYNILIDGLCSKRRVKDAEHVVTHLYCSGRGVDDDGMPIGVNIPPHFYQKLLEGYLSIYKINEADRLFDQWLQRSAIKRETSSSGRSFRRQKDERDSILKGCGQIMNTYCKKRLPEKAEQIFSNFKAVHPSAAQNVVLYGTLFKGYSLAEKPGHFSRLLNQMKMDKVVPNEIIFNTMVHGYAKAKNTEGVNRTLKAMRRDFGVAPTVITYTGILYHYWEHGMTRHVAELDRALKNHENWVMENQRKNSGTQSDNSHSSEDVPAALGEMALDSTDDKKQAPEEPNIEEPPPPRRWEGRISCSSDYHIAMLCGCIGMGYMDQAKLRMYHLRSTFARLRHDQWLTIYKALKPMRDPKPTYDIKARESEEAKQKIINFHAEAEQKKTSLRKTFLKMYPQFREKAEMPRQRRTFSEYNE